MAVKTTTQQLEEVQTAITAVMASQSYSLDGVTVTRANLSALQERERILKAQYNQEQGGRPRVSVAKFGGAAW
jgi:hypothetical protein